MLFSIITINLNNRDGLLQTIQSVLSQDSIDYEYIVIDGDSNDGSKEIIEKFAPQIHYWVSEKDSGIYNAMNKGIKVAQGEFILFLNSGDYFVNEGVLKQVAGLIEPDTQICTGDIFLDNGQVKRLQINPSSISAMNMLWGNISHQSTFIRSNLFRQYGSYDESYQIAADWVFFFKTLILFNEKYQKISIPIAIFNTFGISENPDYQEVHKFERNKAIHNFLPKKILEHFQEYQKIEYLIKGKRFKLLLQIERCLLLRRLLHFVMLVLAFFSKKGSDYGKN